MAVPQRLTHLTEEDYLALERAASSRSEFLDGEMFAMAGGSPMHSLIAANVIRELGNHLRSGPCRPFTSDLRLKVEATGLYTYPDVSVLCGPLQYAAGTDDTVVNPTVLVEVLSDATEGYDRGEKFRHYRQMPALQEYLLVSQRQPRIEQFLRRPGDEWTLRTAEGRDAALLLPALGVTLALREVFAGVEFPPASIRPPTPPRG